MAQQLGDHANFNLTQYQPLRHLIVILATAAYSSEGYHRLGIVVVYQPEGNVNVAENVGGAEGHADRVCAAQVRLRRFGVVKWLPSAMWAPCLHVRRIGAESEPSP